MINERRKKKRKSSYSVWLKTFTKKAVALILGVCLLDLQLSYVLAFMGREVIAESLSSTIAETVIGVMIGYFFKALFETFFEEREKRLNNKTDPEDSDDETPVG
jgi:hypothetical protein